MTATSRRDDSPGPVFLTGLMGSGKTTVGRLLAKRLGWRFADTDLLVERRAGMSVAEIFEAKGEAAFRRMESLALKGLEGEKRLVVATGGGIVLKASNRAWMRRRGLVVHLAASPAAILRRLGAAERARRPLLKRNQLAELARKRAPLYASAEIKVDAAAPASRVSRAIWREIAAKWPLAAGRKTPR